MAKIRFYTHGYLESPPDQFHRNLTKLIDLCWPDMDFEEQMCKTWITDSCLCSSKKDGASVPIKNLSSMWWELPKKTTDDTKKC